MEQIIAHLSRQRKKLKDFDQLEDPGRISAMVDVALISLYNRLTNLMEVDPREMRRHGAILATGEFGRRHLGPFSPVALLYLHTPEKPLKEEVWKSGILRPLQAAGWEVTSHIATRGETVDLCLNDFDWLRAIVESRFICGARGLVDNLRMTLKEEIQTSRKRPSIRTFSPPIRWRPSFGWTR